jgi:hypothetical protein
MADYSCNSANVLQSGTAQKKTGIAGAQLNAGDVLYTDSADSNKLKLANASNINIATVAGIAVTGAYANQSVVYVDGDDDFTHGLGSVANGDVIVLSPNAGKLAPVADLSTGKLPVILMVAKSTTKAHFKITQGSVVKA